MAFPRLVEEVGTLDLLSGHPLKILLDLFTAACYLVAAVAFARLAERYQDEFMLWMGVGAVTASVAFVNYALIPSRFTELLYGGEVLWVCAIGSFLYGALHEIASLEAALVRSAVMAERKRVARDLHDGVVQELAYISTQVAWLSGKAAGTEWQAPLARIKASGDRALDESRGAIAALNRELDEPLGQAVRHAAEEVAERLGAEVRLDVDPAVVVQGDQRDALIRITREAVGNAVRHGGAGTVDLRLSRSGGEVELVIRDDGRGFDLAAPRSPQSFGLTSMKERAESNGGTFLVATSPGAGTVVTITLAVPDGRTRGGSR